MTDEHQGVYDAIDQINLASRDTISYSWIFTPMKLHH